MYTLEKTLKIQINYINGTWQCLTVRFKSLKEFKNFCEKISRKHGVEGVQLCFEEEEELEHEIVDATAAESYLEEAVVTLPDK